MTTLPHSHDLVCVGDDCVSGTRNRFFRHKQMRAEEFRIEQAYAIERRRLINRAVLGWGVVYGFGVEGPMQGSITVKPGLGFDQHGREAVVADPTKLSPRNTFLRQRDANNWCAHTLENIKPGRYVLAVHYAERPFGDANLPHRCTCDPPQMNFTCETVLFSLRALDETKSCPCGEPACCSCGCGSDSCGNCGRGVHACLCKWLTEAKIPDAADLRCDWHGTWIDPCDPIELGCVTVVTSNDPCVPLAFGKIEDECGPRRLVKSNDLLYDLARGCDLTRIEKISWGKWHRHRDAMPWTQFIKLLGDPIDPEVKDTAITRLAVRFSAPVRHDTLTPDCFSISFVVTGEDTGWYEKRVVPIAGIAFALPEGGDPSGTTREATLIVQSRWQQEVLQVAGKLRTEEATVQIEVFGDYILDCNGQAVDANARGFALFDDGIRKPEPSGNGSAGGTFLSVFRVQKRQGRVAPAAVDRVATEGVE